MSSFSQHIQARNRRLSSSPAAPYYSKLGIKALADRLSIPRTETLCSVDDPHELPDYSRAVYKANRGHSSVRVVLRDGGMDLLRQRPATIKQVRDYLAAETTQGHADGYFAEDLVLLGGGPARDLKVYSFAGTNAVILYKDQALRKRGWYTLDWSLLPPLVPRPNTDTEFLIAPPARLEQALAWASLVTRTLGTFFRVDFLQADDGWFLGELTPTPNGGRGYTDAADRLLGAYWELCCPDRL